MSQESLEERSQEGEVVVRDVAFELKEFFAKDPLFGLYGVPDECGKYPSDYLQQDNFYQSE